VIFNSKRRRVRCIAHIINLSLQAFLLAKSQEAINAALEASTDVAGEDLFDHFTAALASRQTSTNEASGPSAGSAPASARTRGRRRNSQTQHQGFEGIGALPALQQLHNLAIWIRSSTHRQGRWDKAIGIRLGIDNITRWSSWYTMLGKALQKKPLIMEFLMDNEWDLEGNHLTASDWDLIGKAHLFLQPFAAATLYAEGDTTSITSTLVLMDALLRHYEQQKVRGISD
jgi:hypothetical protein